MVGYIYLITDTTNGKQYVGQHHYDKEELDLNYHGSGHIIKMIYKKRPETLKEVYLKTCYTQEELDEWEKYFIFTFDTIYPNGYNLTEGGNGGVPCEETRRKLSKASKGRHHTEETKRKISKTKKNNIPSGKEHYLFGRHLTEEHKRKIGESNKGRHLTEEHKRKLSETHKGISPSNKGVPMSEEQKKKLSDAHKGKKLSEEHRKKLSEVRTGLYNTKKSKPVLQLSLNGELIREWPSTREIERQLGYKNQAISNCCNQRTKSSYGFVWKYKD